jgi:hypothetical protein
MLENLLEFTGSQTVPPRRRSLVASLQKNSFFWLRAQSAGLSSSWRVSLINEKASYFCEASTYPKRTKVANG